MTEYRLKIFESLFLELQWTTSRTEKELLVKEFEDKHPDFKEDWIYILETLDGRHPIGWTMTSLYNVQDLDGVKMFNSIKEMIQYCEALPNKSNLAIAKCEKALAPYLAFLAPIVNRTLRLGIGKSLLKTRSYTPMLAKKYEGDYLPKDVVVTEKLDGNRCIAAYNKDKEAWEFRSRSGKLMQVNFDMTGMNQDLVYDGEVMSTAQTLASEKRYRAILDDVRFDTIDDTQKSQLLFNETSGLINRHGTKSGLIYNVFDIITDGRYNERRKMLAECEFRSPDLRLLPTLYSGNNRDYINVLLDMIVQMGGEGIMLNISTAEYEQKRSNALLKYKQVQYIDMRVNDVYLGTGKYAGLIGGLRCEMTTEDGKHISCDVGSGLCDADRIGWLLHPEAIIGSIVQVGYHELTQNRADIGTNNYSLRFPRLIKVRFDKNETSEY